MATQAQQDLFGAVYDAVIGMGYSHNQATLAAAQAVHESGANGKAPGNSYFGIKGNYQGNSVNFATTEFAGQKQRDNFRAYDGLEQAVKDYVAFMESNFPAAWHAQTLPEMAANLQNGKFGEYGTHRNKAGDWIYGDLVSNYFDLAPNKASWQDYVTAEYKPSIDDEMLQTPGARYDATRGINIGTPQFQADINQPQSMPSLSGVMGGTPYSSTEPQPQSMPSLNSEIMGGLPPEQQAAPHIERSDWRDVFDAPFSDFESAWNATAPMPETQSMPSLSGVMGGAPYSPMPEQPQTDVYSNFDAQTGLPTPGMFGVASDIAVPGPVGPQPQEMPSLNAEIMGGVQPQAPAISIQEAYGQFHDSIVDPIDPITSLAGSVTPPAPPAPAVAPPAASTYAPIDDAVPATGVPAVPSPSPVVGTNPSQVTNIGPSGTTYGNPHQPGSLLGGLLSGPASYLGALVSTPQAPSNPGIGGLFGNIGSAMQGFGDAIGGFGFGDPNGADMGWGDFSYGGFFSGMNPMGGFVGWSQHADPYGFGGGGYDPTPT